MRKSTKVRTPEFSTNDFMFDKESNSFVTEHSSIMERAKVLGAFYLRSERSGEAVLFLLEEVVKRENEILCWKFRLNWAYESEYPKLRGVRCTIYND